jgi:flagellar hook protein FlgE
MALYGAFSSAVLGMMSQASALHNIGTNVANVNTGGYKRTDTNFSTVLSRSMQSLSDNGGVRPTDTATITQQGTVTTSSLATDVAIAGRGFFALNTNQDGSGTSLFTRDGNFGVSTVNDISVTGIGGTTTITKDGYLTDKNGYFVQGWAYSGGTVNTSGTPTSLRVDQFSFLNQFDPTTAGILNMNLPAGDAVTDIAQVDTLAIGGTIEAGDTYSVSIDGTTVSYTAIGGDTATTVRDALVPLITALPGVTAAAGGTINELTITADVAGVPFAATAWAPTMGATADNTAIITHPVANASTRVHQYAISVFDSAGTAQSAMLNFSKTGVLTWNVSTTTSQTPVAQVDTITLGGTPGEAGDKYTATINGNTVTYTTTGTEATIDDIRDGLLNVINLDGQITANATATTGATGEIVLTAVTAGNPLTTSVLANQGPVVSVAQVDTVTLNGTFEAGDQFTVTINGTPVTYTAVGGDLSLNGVASSLAGAITGAGLGVTAVAVGNQLTITAGTAGTAFTATTSTVNVALGTDDQTALDAPVTTNVTALTDNTASVATTTANATSTVTSSTTPITFNSNGTLNSPTTLNLDLMFNGGSTATVALDISKFTEFHGDFTPHSYTKNGFASANMKSFSFDEMGNIVGSFDDGTYRNVYKLSLGVFANANGLDAQNGNVYAATPDSGAVTYVAAGVNGYALFAPNALELSNVDIADEFTKMMTTQTAYTASSKVFTTADEMLQVARDLKR